MNRLPRTYFGDPLLREKAKPVPLANIKKPSFQKLIKQMFFTMREVGGVGLAAPQIGLPLQLAVIKIGKTPTRKNLAALPPIVLINPKIESHSKAELQDWEGCLSLPAVRGFVPRYKQIIVSYYDETGKKQRRIIDKFFMARVFQHEIDHLNGMLYVDRMRGMQSLMTLGEYMKRIPGKAKK
jgi:peptide deformylase